MDSFAITTCAILVPGVLWASWIDYAERRVPNWLNATLLVFGLMAQFSFHGWAGVQHGFFGALVGFGVLILPWCMHAMGAGDVKLMAAIGMWFGAPMTLVSFAIGAILGGVIAMFMIMSSGRSQMALANARTIMTKFQKPETAFGNYGSAKSFGNTSQLLPYGVPLTIGSLIVLTIRLVNGGF